ncbi:hypothetical protein AB0425_04990 [Actinosynnema sp. NPDC051121]
MSRTPVGWTASITAPCGGGGGDADDGTIQLSIGVFSDFGHTALIEEYQAAHPGIAPGGGGNRGGSFPAVLEQTGHPKEAYETGSEQQKRIFGNSAESLESHLPRHEGRRGDPGLQQRPLVRGSPLRTLRRWSCPR